MSRRPSLALIGSPFEVVLVEVVYIEACLIVK